MEIFAFFESVRLSRKLSHMKIISSIYCYRNCTGTFYMYRKINTCVQCPSFIFAKFSPNKNNHVYSTRTLPFSLSAEERKLVVMESFSDVVYFVRIPAFFVSHGSKVSSRSSDTYNATRYSKIIASCGSFDSIVHVYSR